VDRRAGKDVRAAGRQHGRCEHQTPAPPAFTQMLPVTHHRISG
jgi:hypothetical protein